MTSTHKVLLDLEDAQTENIYTISLTSEVLRFKCTFDERKQ